jgi:hypothetical protein
VTNSASEAFLLTETTIQANVMSHTRTQSDQLARYFAEDLEQLVSLAKINLAKEFGFPPEYPSSNQDVIDMLYEDLAHMLRGNLITGIHLVLREPHADPNTGFYPVRYHVHYTVGSKTENISGISHGHLGGLTPPPPEVWQDARFALLIDWNSTTKERVCRPEYLFDWIPDEAHFDSTNLIHYRNEHLAVDGASVLQMTEAGAKLKDFFISYASEDWPWARWIAQQLEEAGYNTVLPERDFLAGSITYWKKK